MKKCNLTPMDAYHICYSTSPDILADVYSATKGTVKDQSLDYGKD